MVMARQNRSEWPTTACLAGAIRRLVIEHSYRAHVGHIGSSLSIAEILAALYGSVLRGRPGDADRDRFVLSKGHAALALFAVLALTERLDSVELEAFGIAGSPLGVHPEPGIPGIDFGTGRSARASRSVPAGARGPDAGPRARTFVLMSDGELNEGAVWEAAQFAAHHGLRNLVAVVDLNGQQAFGATAEVPRFPTSTARSPRLDGRSCAVNGHDAVALAEALGVTGTRGAPRVVLAETEFGHGVSFMERQLQWHYLPLDAAQYAGDRGTRPAVRATFVETLTEMAESDERIVLLTGDLGFMALEPFREAHSDRFFNVGVAEQNLMGLATGLADAGFTPYCYSIATFASLRGFELFRNGAVWHRLPVRVVGMGGGFEYGAAGITHHALEDIGVMRLLPSVTVVAPADAGQTGPAVRYAQSRPGPVYIRLGKDDRRRVPSLDGAFDPEHGALSRATSRGLRARLGGIATEAAVAVDALAALAPTARSASCRCSHRHPERTSSSLSARTRGSLRWRRTSRAARSERSSPRSSSPRVSCGPSSAAASMIRWLRAEPAANPFSTTCMESRRAGLSSGSADLWRRSHDQRARTLDCPSRIL